MSPVLKRAPLHRPAGDVDPIRRRAELLIGNLTAAMADLDDVTSRRAARRYIADVWRGAAGVKVAPGVYYRVLVSALDAAHFRHRRALRVPDVVFQVRVVRSVIKLTFPEVEIGIDDETIRTAVERWPTKRHDKWEALLALLWAMGLKTTKTAAVRKGIRRAIERALDP